jgi:ATP-binding protein involved in chromosome partitioning
VTTPFHASVSDTSRTVELFRDNDVPVLGTVVNMAEYVCDCCGEPNDLFTGDALGDLNAEVLTELPFSHELQGTPAPGNVPDAVSDLGDAVADALDTAGEVDVDPTADIRGLPPQERKDLVREQFTALEGGDSFVLVSDRDPTPVGQFLGRLAEAPREAFDPFEVRRATPTDWVLETVKP